MSAQYKSPTTETIFEVEPTADLAQLKQSMAALQQDVNAFLTKQMEEEKSHDEQAEADYGEEVDGGLHRD